MRVRDGKIEYDADPSGDKDDQNCLYESRTKYLPSILTLKSYDGDPSCDKDDQKCLLVKNKISDQIFTLKYYDKDDNSWDTYCI